MLRFLLAFLALDIAVLGCWLWKGPDLLAPLVPRILASYLPNIHQALRYENATIDRAGVITFRQATVSIPGAIPMRLQAPLMKVNLSFATLSHLKPVFANLQIDSAFVTLPATALPTDLFAYADSALQTLHDLPDLQAFEKSRIRLGVVIGVQGTDTVGKVENLRVVFRRDGWASHWRARFSAQGNYQGDRVRLDSVAVHFFKPTGKAFQLDSIQIATAKVQIAPTHTQWSGRNEILSYLATARDYGWKRHGAFARAQIGKVRMSQAGRFEMVARHVSAEADSSWRLRFSARGWVQNETVRMDSVFMVLRLPADSGRIQVDSLLLDTLIVQAKNGFQAFATRSEVSDTLWQLRRQAPLRLLEGSRMRVGYFAYFMDDQNYLRIQSLRWSQTQDDYRLSTERWATLFQEEGMSAQSLQAQITCPRPGAGCRIRSVQTDTLKIALPASRVQNGPVAMIQNVASYRTDKMWQMLESKSVRIPVYQLTAGSQFQWRLSGAQWTVNTRADSVRMRLQYQRWQARDAHLAGGWLVRRAQQLSKGTFHSKNLGALLDTLDFGEGTLELVLGPRKVALDWDMGKNVQTRSHSHLTTQADLNRGLLSGNWKVRGLSVAQVFPQVFDKAFLQGVRMGGVANGQLDFSVKLADFDALQAFKATGKWDLQGVELSGLDLQKQSLIRSKAPIYTGRVPFNEVRCDRATLDSKGMQCDALYARGPLLSFSGRLNARYDASFALNSSAVIPPRAAAQLPTLTRNGLESTPDNSLKTQLVVTGTPVRQTLANEEKIFFSAVRNNIRTGFGFFKKK